MKAVRFYEHGGPEVLKYEDIPELADPKEFEAQLEIKAISVNHLDLWLRRGIPGLKVPLPHIAGADASGIIKKVGSKVSALTPGQRVLINPSIYCGKCNFCVEGNASMCVKYEILGESRDGTYAEYINLPAENFIPIPDDVSFEEAAAVPLVFMTAWRMLITRGKLKPGDDILILAAGAGVGTACIQIAKLCGARVFAAAGSNEKLERARSLGADFVINYNEEDFAKRIRELTNRRGVDIVVDYLGADTWSKSLQSLRKGGRLLTCGATTGYDPKEDIRFIFYRQLEIIGSTMGSAKELNDVLKLIFAGKLKPVIHKVMRLSEASQAHKLIESRSVFGKIVLVP
jgi:NADPH:quinone reductase-like Zn-dependent oxidoreductase